ncbi:monovalent cation/H(+) antiporter subunit G [Thiorhodococcus mannitoliphagus]|uniref:Monovalent cation/H(+) antiporter subunit G n=1 Tax=Thiorhodococcus mannitoliphagus TaxID=329406 RepID=A0A6P1DTC5_9GAMM|nr:monovalent cation/H(+) antiporter subunit G [Thiorhodococcus mannitoliphagus]
MLLETVSLLLVGAGAFFFAVGTLGLVRLPDLFCRLHALTKADNLGLGLVIAGLLPWAADPFLALKLVLIWLLVMLSGATGSYLIAKRALRGDGEDLLE